MSASDTTTTGGFETITAAALEAWIANWLVRNADVPAADIKRDLEFFDYGLDSLHAVDLSGHLEELLGRPLSPSLAWEFPDHLRTGRAPRRRRQRNPGRSGRGLKATMSTAHSVSQVL